MMFRSTVVAAVFCTVLFAHFLPGEAEDDRLSGEELLELLEGDLPSVQSDDDRILHDLSLKEDLTDSSHGGSSGSLPRGCSSSDDDDQCMKALSGNTWVNWKCSHHMEWKYVKWDKVLTQTRGGTNKIDMYKPLYCSNYHLAAQIRKCCPYTCNRFRDKASYRGKLLDCSPNQTPSPARPADVRESDLGMDCHDDDECLNVNTNWGPSYTCSYSAGNYNAYSSYCKHFPKEMHTCCKRSCPLGAFTENMKGTSLNFENGYVTLPSEDSDLNIVYDTGKRDLNGAMSITKVEGSFGGEVKGSFGTFKNPKRKCSVPFQWIRNVSSPEDWRPLKAIDASQSSDWQGWYGKRAIDGDRSTCSMTNAGQGGWLRIDLGDYYEIRSVKIIDRALQTQLTRLKTATDYQEGTEAEKDQDLGNELDKTVEALSGTQVKVQDSKRNYIDVGDCGAGEGLPSGISNAMSEVRCLAKDGRSGRPVGDAIFLKRGDRLGVCEVEVWARPAKSVQGLECSVVYKAEDVNKKVEIKDGKIKVDGLFRTLKYVTSDIPSDGEYEIAHVGRPSPQNQNGLKTSQAYEQAESADVDKGDSIVTLKDAAETEFHNPAGNTKVAGSWVFAKSASVESEFSYTVGVSTSEGTTTSKAWSSSVEDSMTHGWSFEATACGGLGASNSDCGEEMIQTQFIGGTLSTTIGASGEYSSTTARSQETAEEVSEELGSSEEKSMTYTLPPGAVWQWEYSVADACTTARRSSPVMIKVDHLAVTDNQAAPPCCLPGYFVDPTKPHGACIALNATHPSPCLTGCTKAICELSASTGECNEAIKGLKDLGLSKELMQPLLIPVLKKCPTMTAEDVLSRLDLS